SIFGTKYQPGEDIGIFISRVKTAATRLQEAGHRIGRPVHRLSINKVASSEIRSHRATNLQMERRGLQSCQIEAELILEANRLSKLMKQDLEKAEEYLLEQFHGASKKSKTLPGATAAAHGDQMAIMITKEKW
ncbi:retrovirus-related Pol polyprotein from transposon TNT 1-94, partial [Trichonephila clavipes]